MKIYAKNKKAYFDYEILKTFEAGLVLSGAETKSIRTGNIKLSGTYITFHKGKAQITNLHIPRYKYAAHDPSYDPEKSRPILLHKKEMLYLQGKLQEKGLTIVPLLLYNKGRYIKLEIGLAKGKKLHDKKETIKQRDQKREMARAKKELM